MGQYTTIEWTDHTFNPWWGCTKVSPGCKHCYAENWAGRYGHDVWGTCKSRRTFGDRHWNEPLKWNAKAARLGKRYRVFCASMADVFEDHPDLDAERLKLWDLIGRTPMLDWLLLTKRPQHIIPMTPPEWSLQWPLNVWPMTSVEDQAQAEQRIPLLLDIPASIRGLSVEPLIGPVDITQWLDAIQWVIVGGESGHYARPMHPDWVRSLRDQCQVANVAFFFKQWGTLYPVETGQNGMADVDFRRTGKKAAGRELDGRIWDEVPCVETLLNNACPPL